MNHAEYEEQLWDFHDGELSAARRPAMESHLASCPSCRETLASWKSLSSAVFQPLKAPPRAGFSGRVLARLETSQKSQASWRVSWGGLLAPVLGALAVVAVLSALRLPEPVGFTAETVLGDEATENVELASWNPNSDMLPEWMVNDNE